MSTNLSEEFAAILQLGRDETVRPKEAERVCSDNHHQGNDHE